MCPCFSIWLQKSCPKLVDPLEIHNIPNISMNGQVLSNEFDISRLDNILWPFVAFNTFDISLIQQNYTKCNNWSWQRSLYHIARTRHVLIRYLTYCKMGALLALLFSFPSKKSMLMELVMEAQNSGNVSLQTSPDKPQKCVNAFREVVKNGYFTARLTVRVDLTTTITIPPYCLLLLW